MHKYIKCFCKDFNTITKYYKYLVNKTKNLDYVGTTNEWLIDNYYLIVDYKNNIFNNKTALSKKLKKSNDIYNAIKNIAIENEYNITYRILVRELNAYQRKNSCFFTYEQISCIKEILTFVYIEKLSQVCTEINNELNIKEEMLRKIDDIDNYNNIELEQLITFDIRDYNYIFELNNSLKSKGIKTKTLFRKFNNLLEKNNISLRDVLNEEYKRRADINILIGNIFRNLKDFSSYMNENIISSVSMGERLLINDKTYLRMTEETKSLYREQISKLAKRKKVTEIEYIEGLMLQYAKDDKHIGFYLFDTSPKEYRFYLYISIISILTVILSICLSKYFISSRVLAFIVLLIPIYLLLTEMINQMLIHIIPTKSIFKMNYSKKLPEASSTMVVVPTIISDTKKIDKIFEQLETFYLANKTDNLYFTLLGDVKESSKEYLDIDREISKYGKEYVEKLNKKYKKNIFFFVYRKRVWSRSEDSFLGYERKRGALIQFNKLLLKEMTKNEEKKYFNVNTLNTLEKRIKYVVPLDTDTNLVLNSLLNLVGAMAHPLNNPIINEKGNKVISGYAVMQPRVNVDISSTNKSIYSQIFAGIGGFDTYSKLCPNLNQDLFGEGTFIGKGIYDLDVFNEVLSERFEDNLILSHDLLEGNYLRCAYVSDVEFIEDFPSKFLVDATRLHRWARGDTQIIKYLFPNVKNKEGIKEKNPLTFFEKFKIFNNILRIFTYPIIFIMFLLTCFLAKYKILWILFILLVISYPIVIFLKNKLYSDNDGKIKVYYKNLIFGGKALIYRTIFDISALPYYSKIYLDAFIKSLYRMIISHKKLLNWLTAEDAEKNLFTSLSIYFIEFSFNIIVGLILIVLGFKNIYSLILGILFIIFPLIVNYVSKEKSSASKRLNKKEDNFIFGIAKRTWCYFEDNLCEEYNYLIPDNYEELRDEKIDFKTSPTNIGYSLTSVISAYELGFIDVSSAISYLNNILKSVDSLKKWNGHLYNWYDIKTKEVLMPHFISTVDSGNFIASLIIVRNFLEDKNEELLKLCNKLINNTNFKKLYTKTDVFSIGYMEDENTLSNYNYNKFASESRLTSFVAISKGDAPSKHWFSLDKTLITYHHVKGLTSWNGTAFEYYMPLLFMKNYSNTLLDESYNFAHICQKSFAKSIDKNLPWGVSEAAYNELDNEENYKYKSFSIPFLKAKEEKLDRVVISPYSSIMALELFPEDVYKNMLRLKQLNMVFKYGFYESYDYDTRNIVRACFSHHQGMILMGITNYLKNNKLKDYFHNDVKVKAYDILLKERVQVRANIDMKIENVKKYNYEKEVIHNDIRTFNYISDMPEVSAISNRKYTLLMNDRGNSFSRYRTLQLNRYRKITEQDYGMFLYIKDIKTGKVWSNTYAPINEEPDRYEVVFSTDKIKYIRQDGDICTKTEIIVAANNNAEIRKFTFTNEGDLEKVLELTTYTEPILSENISDISHRAFNNMFLETKYDTNTNSYIAIRKSRDNDSKCYMVNRLIVNNPKGNYSYENDRLKFIGRNRTVNNPIALNNKLSNPTSSSIDSVLSIRNKIEVPAHSKTEVYFISGFGRSMSQIDEIISSYSDKNQVDKAFKLSSSMNVIMTKNMNLTGEEMSLFNTMLNYLYQTTKISVNEERRSFLRENALSQKNLWKFGISGDRPIILVNISDIGDVSFIYEILKCFEYFKNKSIFVDIIILNRDKESYSHIEKVVNDELYRIYKENSFLHTPGNVKVICSYNLTEEEKSLLKIVPRLIFNVKNHHSLKDEVEILEEKNKINRTYPSKLQVNLEKKYDDKLEFNNEYGGFRDGGREYVITNKDTPTPWSNVISNDNFGTIVTNNGCGYTYCYNSNEFKITSWTNEMVVNDKSEGIKINGKIFDPIKCIHGFGYTILEGETNELTTTVTEYVPIEESVKVFIVKLKNKLDIVQKLDLSFFINPTLGNFEEKTSRHILTEFIENDNYLKLRNVYSNDYSDVVVFLSSSEKIKSATTDKILIKDINTDIELASGEEKELVFTLGCSKSHLDMLSILFKYKKLNLVKEELENVKKYWNSSLSKIEVKTPDTSLNYVLNGWYLYQTISSRLNAKAGFYQVSGAFGYRNQLQDAMNICIVDSDKTRNQILINAKHQFIEGDVLHWWNDQNNFGLRSRYKDDYLWLVYATIYYLKLTDDKEILSQKIEFVEGEELTEHERERGITFTYTKEKKTLLEHLILSIDLSINSLGPHNLPLMGGGDWNDGMNLVGIKGNGESIWLGFFLYQIVDEFVKLAKKYKLEIDTKKYEKFNEKLKININRFGYDNKYYLRAYFDNGDKLGSKKNDECKIDLISQSFSILSEVVPNYRITSVINSVEENLVDKENGLIKLLTPAFKNSLNNPGYIMNYPEGIRENGGQYTHASIWYIMALIKLGYSDKAYEYYQMINPINHSNNKKMVDKYMVEPYVIAADIYTSNNYLGRGGWTWYTGSAGWFYRVGIEYILGLRKEGNKLYINPSIPNSWNEYEVKYNYLETIYNIKVIIGEEKSITVNGKKLKTNYIKLDNENKNYDVLVYIKGAKND